SSSLSRALNDSTYPFSHGEPGAMYAALAPTAVIHLCTALATNSGPLSDRMWPGTPQDEQVREHVDDVDGLQLAIHPDGQTLVREFIDHIEHPELASIVGAVLDEVIRPHVIGVLRPQSDAGPVCAPQP